MKKVAATIMAKADEILRSISNNLSNGLLEAINGNVQAAKRKAKGYRTKHNLKLMVYLIAGGVLDALPLKQRRASFLPYSGNTSIANDRFPPLRAVRGNRSQVIRKRQESTHCGRSALHNAGRSGARRSHQRVEKLDQGGFRSAMDNW